MSKRPDSGINGILVVDKPQDFTSFDVVAKLRGIAGTRKIGHSGTLDPMATGVLPTFLGPAAKGVDLQPNHDKTYEATFLFGLATDTGDITGQVLKRQEVHIDRQRLEAALAAFCGPIVQLPPMYSAVKVNGKPLYKYAREGKQVERKPRQVTIHHIEYMGQEGENRHRVRVHCGKGTYIRTLVEDVGAALGVPATLAALRRTQAGVFTTAQAHTFAEIQAAKDAGRLEALLLPISHVFQTEPRLELNEALLRRLQHGAPISGMQSPPGRYAAWLGEQFVGLVQITGDGGLRGQKLFLPHPGQPGEEQGQDAQN